MKLNKTILAVCVLALFLALPAFADVTVVNQVNETINLDVVVGKDTNHTLINPMATMKVGGSGATTIMLMGNDGKELAKGTFKSGDKVFISKSPKGYKIAKPAPPPKPKASPTVKPAAVGTPKPATSPVPPVLKAPPTKK